MEKVLKIVKRDTICNFVAAALWSYYTWNCGKAFLVQGQSLFLLLLLRNSIIVLLFLIRREASSVSKNAIHWIVAVLTTLFAFTFKTEGANPLVPLAYSNLLFIIGATVACYSAFNLGRSFGIAPANRGIVTGELYSYVRHPMYASYIIMDVAIVLSAFSWLNLMIFVALLLLFYVRAHFEEEFLKQDPFYTQYCEMVRFRFIPGVL